MKAVLLILISVIIGFSQDALFGTASSPKDTVTVYGSTKVTSRVIYYQYPAEGIGSLWLGGDYKSGTKAGILGEYSLWYGKTADGDECWGQWISLDTVLTYSEKGASQYGSGTIDGAITKMTGDDWAKSYGIIFRFWGVGDTTLLIGKFGVH